MKKLFLTLAVLGVVVAPAAASAEVVTLIDNTRIHGQLIHYFDGVVTLKTADGTKIKLPASKIKSMQFKVPKARTAYSTPSRTFNLWKQTLLQGKLGKHVGCYALMYQMMMTNMMGAMSQSELGKMVAGHKKTRYVIRKTRYKGKALAFLTVDATLPGKEPQRGELLFVKENGEWKMVPPRFQRPPQ